MSQDVQSNTSYEPFSLEPVYIEANRAFVEGQSLDGVQRILDLACGTGTTAELLLGRMPNAHLNGLDFDPVQIESATFTGPSAHTLMFFTSPNPVLDFDIGLIAGVFAGAFLATLCTKELQFMGFESADNMKRAIIGAALMGMGGMLAGGCAIGAGVTGGSIFAATAWLALFCMWIGAVITSRIVDKQRPATLSV